MRHQTLVFVAAAALTSAALILPASSVLAQSWTVSKGVTNISKDGTIVRSDGGPMIVGSGRIVRQGRPVAAFDRVETLGSEDVEVRFGPRPSLVIAADDNILPLITSRVRNGTLELGTRGSFRMRGPIRVWITTPRLDAFQSSGSGNVVIHGVNNQRLAMTINGSGNFSATGRTNHLALDIHGSGTGRLAGLVAGNARVAIFGSGDATVRTTGTLDTQIYGSGTIRYVGRPSDVRQQRFGSGRVIAAN